MAVTITKRLVGGFAAVVAVTATMGIFGTVSMRSVASNADVTATTFLPEARHVEEIMSTLGGMRQNGQLYMLTGNEDAWKKYDEGRTHVKEILGKATASAAAHEELAVLRGDLARVADLAGQCSNAMESTRQNHAAMNVAIATANEAGPALARELALMLERQQERLADDRAKVAAAASVIREAEAAQRGVTDLRLSNFKAQAAIDATPLSGANETFAAISRSLDTIAANAPDSRDEVSRIRASLQEYKTALGSLRVELPQLAATMARRTDVVDRIGGVLDNLYKTTMGKTTEYAQQTLSTANRSAALLLGGAVAGTLLAVGLATFIARGVKRAIQSVAQILSMGTDQTAGASAQVSSSAESLAQGASEQAASLEESSSAIEEMSSMIRRNADTTQQANALASDAKRAADSGSQAMEKMSGAIADIERASQETAKIIRTIDEIAFQTNLLALNAAVEAARAGEAGKGFAVVAEEVRNLAMRSAEAAKNTSSLIEESVGKAKNGVSIAQTVASILTEINGSTSKVNALIAEIAAASKDQSTGIEQISGAMGQMDKVTQTNAANAEETAAASEELSAQAQQLQKCARDLRELVGLPNAETAPIAPHTRPVSKKADAGGNAVQTSPRAAAGSIGAAKADFAAFSEAA